MTMQIGIDSFAAAFDDTSLALRESDRLRDLRAIEGIGTHNAPLMREGLAGDRAA
jgi:hypothetical protein